MTRRSALIPLPFSFPLDPTTEDALDLIGEAMAHDAHSLALSSPRYSRAAAILSGDLPDLSL